MMNNSQTSTANKSNVLYPVTTATLFETVSLNKASFTQSTSFKNASILTLFLGGCLALTPSAYASDEVINIQPLQVFSVGSKAQSVEDNASTERVAELKLQQPQVLPVVDRKSREQVIAEYQAGDRLPKFALNKSTAKESVEDAQSTVPKAFSNPIYHEFSIYEASSRLFVDNDGDGFYQTFSVTFDADVYGPDAVEVADVYAELYLSRNGGPWIHYYSTDVFTIIGDTTDDDFEVLTTLHNGYYTDHYDVLIDLYEVGFSDIVATISADDTDNLYALPLESSDRDSIDTGGDSSSDGHGGGALSFLCILLLAGVGVRRCVHKR